MALTLGIGFRPYLLNHIKNVVGTDQTPELKLENVGFINMLQSMNKPQILRLSDGNGGENTVRIKQHQRFTKEFTQTSDNCTNANQLPYFETDVNLGIFRQIAISLDDETVANYPAEVQTMVSEGTPATSMMTELLIQVSSACNALIEGLNIDLLTAFVPGVNRITGNANARTINFTQNTTNLPLNDGLERVLQDYKENLGYGTPKIFGNGFMHGFMLQQIAKGMAQNGLNTAINARGVDFYFDQDSTTSLGANQFVVCQPDSVQLVEYMKYQGPKAGLRGTSEFGTFMLPYQPSPNEKQRLIQFDFQLKFFDCPTTLTDAYYGTTLTVGRGYNLIISKTCGLFQIGSQAYRATDPLTGNNGTLRYVATNN